MAQKIDVLGDSSLEGIILPEDIAHVSSLIEDARDSQDASRYTFLCDKYDVFPEDNTLYESGLAAIAHENAKWGSYEVQDERLSGSVAEIAKQDKISRFLHDAESLYPLASLSRNAEAKAALLVEYFPQKFGEDCSQDLIKYPNPASIGAIFKKLVEFYEKKSVGFKKARF
ncbi:hypothetical protein HN695_05280 [Candidatus Woesearchaeota archaeon]|mgnify:FL=1|jgi:hypothetical protein|nr:hypothetical protein [Candidatus Woesearchaeota archaeon]MBT5272151.1 hypothetical protein [Candidatus Woesearchaeota archaeon]MBT6040478.1 hypothetical protein [Candidatus Woesearchaeota archaeon]MBT6336857.1 hypothetical protein [Candidatus Woesearchaeota archaeon]MBT7927727.1 hypothetical protein [Candidatus Woesearchaeota archaeon]